MDFRKDRKMFDNTSFYSLRAERAGGIIRYYVSFEDARSVVQEIEVSYQVYREFCAFVKCERNLRRWDERHTEQSELTDETLYNRALHPPKSVDETVADDERDERLRQAIKQLPKTQRRRFMLYHEHGFTYAQIAEMEGCKKQSICDSVLLAEKKIRGKLKNLKD
jgi:RNA polymerase sigma-70 factor (ECF subfamily)